MRKYKLINDCSCGDCRYFNGVDYVTIIKSKRSRHGRFHLKDKNGKVSGGLYNISELILIEDAFDISDTEKAFDD